MTETEPTIFIIDDDSAIRSSLSRALEVRNYLVKAYPSAASFLAEFELTHSGCIILDYGMPEMNGLELQAHLCEIGATMPIIFVTGHGGVPESVEAMKAGAIDFLEKPYRTEVLVERIEQALKKDAATSDSRAKARMARERLTTLTTREMEIVSVIVSNPSTATSKEIARRLEISPRTVDHHRARILEKMQIKSVLELIDLAIASRMF